MVVAFGGVWQGALAQGDFLFYESFNTNTIPPNWQNLNLEWQLSDSESKIQYLPSYSTDNNNIAELVSPNIPIPILTPEDSIILELNHFFICDPTANDALKIWFSEDGVTYNNLISITGADLYETSFDITNFISSNSDITLKFEAILHENSNLDVKWDINDVSVKILNKGTTYAAKLEETAGEGKPSDYSKKPVNDIVHCVPLSGDTIYLSLHNDFSQVLHIEELIYNDIEDIINFDITQVYYKITSQDIENNYVPFSLFNLNVGETAIFKIPLITNDSYNYISPSIFTSSNSFYMTFEIKTFDNINAYANIYSQIGDCCTASLDTIIHRDMPNQYSHSIISHYTASTSYIKSSKHISHSEQYAFQAIDSIVLIPGFTAEYNSKFIAHIDSCEIDDESTYKKENLFTDQNNISFLKAYPNPTYNNLEIDFISLKKEKIDLTIYDTWGNIREIIWDQYKTNKGRNTININTQNWFNGIYVVEIQTTFQKYFIKVIKF